MTRLEEIKEYVEREYKNLLKSKNRARSLQGILTKKELLRDHLEEFESLVLKYDKRLKDKDWNKLTDDFEFVKTKVEQSIRILEGTSIIPEKENKRQRRNSDYYIEVVIPTQGLNHSISLEDSQIWEALPFTSSFNISGEVKSFLQDKNQIDREGEKASGEDYPISSSFILQEDASSRFKFPDHISLESETNPENKNHTEDFDFDNTSFIETLERLKNKYYKDSFFFNRLLKKKKTKMPAETTKMMIDAAAIIPIFSGKAEELDPFLLQVDYFATDIPAAASHTPLLNVVYTKLRGDALKRLNDIRAEKWPEVRLKMEKLFQPEKNIGAIFKEIETLHQGYSESFEEYKTRATKIYESVRDIPGQEGNESYVSTHLRKHFLGGLRNHTLISAGKSQRDKSFMDLLEWLQKECEEEEELQDIHRRTKPENSPNSPHRKNYNNMNNNTQGVAYLNNNFRRNNNNNYRNQNRGHNPQANNQNQSYQNNYQNNGSSNNYRNNGNNTNYQNNGSNYHGNRNNNNYQRNDNNHSNYRNSNSFRGNNTDFRPQNNDYRGNGQNNGFNRNDNRGNYQNGHNSNYRNNDRNNDTNNNNRNNGRNSYEGRPFQGNQPRNHQGQYGNNRDYRRDGSKN